MDAEAGEAVEEEEEEEEEVMDGAAEDEEEAPVIPDNPVEHDLLNASTTITKHNTQILMKASTLRNPEVLFFIFFCVS